MADVISLAAEIRERAGKGAARATRRAGRVPAVIYGAKKDPVMISLDPLDLRKQIRGGGFFSRVFEINAGGTKEKVLPRDIQLDPVTDVPLHVDFMRFSADTRITVGVEVVFENEADSPGLKRGGVLNVVRHEVELVCAPGAIPERLVGDLAGKEIGDSLHISDITLPGDVELAIKDRDFTVATIVAPSAVKSEAEEAEEAEGAEEAEAEEEGGSEE